MFLRCTEVRALVDQGKYDDALPALLDLWSASTASQFGRSTASSITSLVQDAARAHQPTRDAFAAIRDKYEAKLNRLPDWDSLIGWIRLNEALDQTDRTLKWIDRVKTTPSGRSTISYVKQLVEELIKDRGDLRDLLFMRSEPREWIVYRGQDLEIALRFGRNSDSDRALEMQDFRKDVALFHVAQLLGDRASNTAKFRELAIKLDDTPEMRLALVEAAIKRIPEGDPARATIRDWAVPMLDQADAAIKAAPNAANAANDALASRAAAARASLAS